MTGRKKTVSVMMTAGKVGKDPLTLALSSIVPTHGEYTFDTHIFGTQCP